jgi:curved DNA-binding protein CbpA
MFQDLFREFQGAGFRFDERFFNQTFFGNRGRVFGGVFIWKPFEGMQQVRTRPEVADQPASTPLPPPLRLLKRLGRKVRGYLFGQPKALPETSSKELDLNYDFTVSSAINREGGWVQIGVPRDRDLETLKVRIPPGIRNGTRLRLKGKGRQENSAVGDLYLTIHFS